MKTCYLTIGFTGSGKSTWAKEFVAKHENTKIVSPDGFRKMFNGTYKYLEELDSIITYCTFYAASQLLYHDYDVIIDCGNLTKNDDRRGKWIQLPADKFVAVVFPTDKPVEWYVERRMRNPHWEGVDWNKIVEGEMAAYQPPTKTEFNEIIYVKEQI